jgi:hypothetical protein
MFRLILCCVLLLVTFSFPAPRPVHAAARCFPEVAPQIADCIDGRIRSFWEAQGGLPIFGYPLGPARRAAGPNGPITVQLFERAQLEHHPQNTPPDDVLLSRLGGNLLAARAEPTPAGEAPRTGCRHFPEVGLNVCPPFLNTYASYGLNLGQPGISPAESLGLFGLPLTPPRPERLADGRIYTVQWFERARFEDHGVGGIRLGLLGVEQSRSAAPSVFAARTPAVAPGGFVQATGDQLTVNGQPVFIKGVNYYPQGRPWKEMWVGWDALQMERELRLGRDQLGINAVRILLPYDLAERGGVGIVNELVLNRLRELSQIASNLELRLIVTLFDFDNSFPPPGSRGDAAHREYLRLLLGNFVGDDRIMAWDLHNEPDHYAAWTREGRRDQVLDWLGRRADEARRLAPNHLITVGMGHYDRLWIPGPDGRRVIDYSDVVSVHSYNAADAARQLDEVRQRTSKPILLEEFGWPTGPTCAVRDYTEAQQEWVYRTFLEASVGRVAGVVAWNLRDYHAGPTSRWDTREEHYGLFRFDDTLKPAAAAFAAVPAPALPSAYKSDVALTSNNPRLPTGTNAPIFIAESGHYVKAEFRQIWDLLNGRYNLGLPLSEGFIRQGDRRAVQYFSGAVLEIHPTARDDPNWPFLTPEQQLFLLVRPADIGAAYSAGRSFPRQTGVPRDPDYYAPETGYTIDPTFRRYYDSFGGAWRFGPPISGKLEEQVGGVAMQVQYFRNGRLERNPVSGAIEVGNLGVWAWGVQCAFAP